MFLDVTSKKGTDYFILFIERQILLKRKIRRETCTASECSPLSYKNSKTIQVATKMEGVKSETKASVVHCDNIF